MEITNSREISSYEIPVKLNVSSSKRFGASESPLTWDLPQGWSEQEPTSLRQINLSFGPNQAGECYFTVLPGSAGGLNANINRWCKQMASAELTDEAIANLPKQTLLGFDAIKIQLDGNYTNMGAQASLPNYRLLGLITQIQDNTLFIKLTGPKDIVAANETAFNQFISSLKINRQ
jgi:hypothetical protein